MGETAVTRRDLRRDRDSCHEERSAVTRRDRDSCFAQWGSSDESRDHRAAKIQRDSCHEERTGENCREIVTAVTRREQLSRGEISVYSLLCICIIVLYCEFVIVYMSDQITLNYVVCIYFASPGASHLLKREKISNRRQTNIFFSFVWHDAHKQRKKYLVLRSHYRIRIL